MSRDSENEKTEKRGNQKPPALEWLAAAIGFILVAGTIGFLIYSAAVAKNTPPTLTVRTNSIETIEGGYLVKFSLYNGGENNAADVVVEGKLAQNGEDLETSSVTIKYSPSHSRREGGLFFTKNPEEFELQIRPLGYEKP